MSKLTLSPEVSDFKEGLFILTDEAGNSVRRYEDDPEQGYIVLKDVQFREITLLTSTRLQLKTRQALYAGPVEVLEKKIAMWEKAGKIPGRIQSLDILEGDPILDNLKNLDRYVKRAGEDGPMLTKEGKKIYHFRKYTANPDALDMLIEHDNKAEVVTHRAAARLASADLDA